MEMVIGARTVFTADVLIHGIDLRTPRGTMSNLEVHHREFRSHSGWDSEENLITLCSACHGRIHRR